MILALVALVVVALNVVEAYRVAPGERRDARGVPRTYG